MKYVAVVFAALGLSAGLMAQAPPKGIIIERIVVKVNGEVMTQSQLTQRQTDAIRQTNPNTQLTDAVVKRLVNQVTPDVLVDAVDEMLLAQRGKELGAALTDSQFKETVEGIKKENNLTEEELVKAMAAEGLSMDQLRGNVERAYLIQAVQRQEIFRRMNITDEELRQFYAGHKEELILPETVTLREITIAGAATPQETATAKAKADAIRARAVAGESFEALVKEASDSATKANGGMVGTLKTEDINPMLRELVDKLQPGQVTEPVPLARGGFQIFQLEARQAAAVPPFDKAREQIEQGIRAERLKIEMAKIVSRLRSQAVIEWKDDTLKQIYQKRLVERTDATGAPIPPPPTVRQ